MSRMGRAAIWVSGGILLSRILGFARDVVITGLLGAGPSADEYVAAFFVPDLLFYLMAGGYLSITFIPILSRHLAAGDEPGGWRSFAAIAKPVVVVMVLFTAAAIAAAGWLVDLIYVQFPGSLPGAPTTSLNPDQITEVIRLTRIVMPAQVFFMLGSLLMAVQYAHQRFIVPSLAPIVYNLSIIVGGVIGSVGGEASAAGFIWGALAGAFIGNFVLQAIGARATGLRWVRGTSIREPVVREYALLSLPLMLGQSVAVLDEQFLRVFGNLAGDGAIAQLSYARRLNMLPVGVIAQAAGVATYPFLARLVAERRDADMYATMTRALRYAIYVSGFAVAAVVGASQTVVRVAFQRGAFDIGDTIATASVLAVLGLTIPMWAAHQIYARGFYAKTQMWTPVAIGTVWAVISIPLYLEFIERQGLLGIPLASLTAMAGYTLNLAIVWYGRTDEAESSVVLWAAGRAAAGASLAGVVIWFAVGALGGELASMSLGRGIAALVGGAIPGALVYVVVTRLFGSTEFSELRRS